MRCKNLCTFFKKKFKLIQIRRERKNTIEYMRLIDFMPQKSEISTDTWINC